MFYEHMKAICKKKHTSPSAVCLALGMSKSNATKWKQGKWPRLDTVMRMAKVLNVPAGRLIPRDDEGQINGSKTE